MVQELVACKMSPRRIGGVLAAYRGNSTPVSKTTVGRLFKSEIEHGRDVLVSEAMAGLRDAVERKERWAVEFVLRAVAGLRDNAPVVVEDKKATSIEVRFVEPVPSRSRR